MEYGIWNAEIPGFFFNVYVVYLPCNISVLHMTVVCAICCEADESRFDDR